MHRFWFLLRLLASSQIALQQVPCPSFPQHNLILLHLIVMRVNELFLALVPVVLANPILRSEKTQDVHIGLELSKEASQAAVTVWNKDQSEAIANSCSESLASGPFDNHAIVFKVDENGSGNLTVGDESYSIGGGDDAIECGRIASQTELVVNCIVSLPGSVELKPLGKRRLKTCFPDGPLRLLRQWTSSRERSSRSHLQMWPRQN